MKPQYIIVHHSLTEDGKTVSWGAIRDYHVKTNGWLDIGYHYGVELIGNHYEVLVGRDATSTGAHCKEGGMNHQSLGVCVVGNFDLAAPPEAQLIRTAKLVASLMRTWNIPAHNIKRHGDYAPKSCPGKLFPWYHFLDLVFQAWGATI